MMNKTIDVLLEEVIGELSRDELRDAEKRIRKYGAHNFSEHFCRKMAAYVSMAEGFRPVMQEQGEDSIATLSLPKKNKVPPMRYLLVAILVAVLIPTAVLAEKLLVGYYQNIKYETDSESIKFHSAEIEALENESLKIFVPSYIPEGYRIEYEDYSTTFFYVNYLWINEEEQILYYDQQRIDYGAGTITSNGEIPVDIKIWDHDGITFVDEGGLRTVLYRDGDYIYSVSGIEDTEELIKILLSIEFVEEK